MSTNKLIRALKREFGPRGWDVRWGKKHPRLCHPDHGEIIFPGSTNSIRVMKNIRSLVRRAEAGQL